MSDFSQWFQDRIASKYYLDLGGGCRNTVLLAGCARSGSTWVSDLINYDNAYRYVFEPFRNDRAEVCRIFEGRQYLRPDAAEPRYYEASVQVLTGRLRQRWSDKHNAKLIARRRLVKAIRANLMLKWLRVRFPELRMLLLLRHPLAVASSKLKLNWPADLDTFLRQDDLMRTHLEPFRDLLTGDLSPFEEQVLFWCVEHYVPLRELDSGDAEIFFYERFCTEPEREIARLFAFLGRGSVSDAMRVLARPSSTTTNQAAISTGESLTHAWERHITEEQRRAAREMLDRFGLHRLYLESGLPNDTPEEVFGEIRARGD
jgi:hypothetical protein